MVSRNPLTDPRRGDIISANGCDIGREVNHVDRFRVDYSPWKGGGAECRPDNSCSLENWRRWCREHKATIVKRGHK
jgi:hypothetical protein